MLRTLAVVALATLPWTAAPSWTPQQSGTRAEFRGLSAASHGGVVWLGGRGGTFARTTDGGATWHADTVPGARGLFFIDVYGASAETAYLVGTSFDSTVADARIYKTTDGGRKWTLQYRDTTAGIFLDGTAFWDASHGVVFGDPQGGTFVVLVTANGGRTWRRVPASRLPAALPGEGGFAASGTAIATAGRSDVWFATGGGAHARVFHSADRGRNWTVAATPLAGGETTGLFGIAFRDPRHGIAVGGDYTLRHSGAPNVLRTADGGRTWRVVGTAAPAGVRYGVVYIPGGKTPTWLAVGPSGSGYSTDGGEHWTVVDTVGYNTVGFAGRSAGWAAGPNGRVARWSW